MLKLYKLDDYSFDFSFVTSSSNKYTKSQVLAIKLLNEDKESAEMDLAKTEFAQIDTKLDTLGKILLNLEHYNTGVESRVILTVRVRISDSSTPIMVLKQQTVDIDSGNI